MFRRLLTSRIRTLFKMPTQVELPLIIVAGCTGTGKSDLGVALAEKFSGEIISADSMQIYKGLFPST